MSGSRSLANTRNLLLITAGEYPWPTLFFSLLGAVYTARFVFRISTILLQTFLLPGRRLKAFGATKGAWAVVTGATDGIGREFALQLAKGGFNIFLASRNEEKLRALSSEIENQFAVQTNIQAIDFSKVDDPAWERLASELATLQVGVLVNNVARSHEMPTDFSETPQEEIDSILQINIHSTLNITSIILPGMIARKRGLILNLASLVGVAFPAPMLATYSGSKAFLQNWAQSLAKEVESKGILVQVLSTAFVTTNMSKIRRPTPMVPTPKAYVRAALSKIGIPGGSLGQPYTGTPYWSHSLLSALISELNWPSLVMSYVFGLHKDIRKRALRKREREAAALKEE